MTYKLFTTLRNNTVIIKLNDDGSSVSFQPHEDNTDYQQYLKWLAEGNTPQEADDGAN